MPVGPIWFPVPQEPLSRGVVYFLEDSAMNVLDEHTRSLWMGVPVVTAPSLVGPQRADVAVIGSGIAGLSVAYELASRGRSVVVLDRGPIGSGMTASNTAHLASAIDDDYKEQVKVRRPDCGRIYSETQAM